MSVQFAVKNAIGDAHAADIFAMAVCGDRFAVTAGGDSAVRVWDLRSPDLVMLREMERKHSFGVHAVACTPLGASRALAVTSGFNHECFIWDLDSMSFYATLEASPTRTVPLSKAWAVALAPDGAYLATAAYDGTLSFWDIRERDKLVRVHESTPRQDFAMCLGYSADGTRVVVGHASGALYVYSAPDCALVHNLPGQSQAVRAVAFSPGGTLLAAAGDDKTITVYDAKNGEQIACFTGHHGWIFSLDWNETGELLLSTSIDTKVRVWDMSQRTCVSTLHESAGSVWCGRWHRDPHFQGPSKFLAAGEDRTLRYYRGL